MTFPRAGRIASTGDPARAFFSRLRIVVFAGFALSVLSGTLRAEDRYDAQLIEKARALHLAEQSYWQRLLHVRRNFLGLKRSEVDDPAFFLSPRGRTHPDQELDATLAAFFEPADPRLPETQTAQCRFPARYAWLKETLKFDPARLSEQNCPRFETWKDRMNPVSVDVIFASYYMNNPASMYGHTFLRLRHASYRDTQRLLDYTVNYAAAVDTHNGILFAVYGLAGGYRGKFSTMPYYMKVQEYNNMESRDLWEYSLNLEPTAVTRLVQHLWELGQGSIAYYFLNKNCSYQLLPVLEVADPKLDLSRRFLLKAIPVDTLRAILRVPGLADQGVLRPSHVSKMLASREALSEEEIRTVERLLKVSAAQRASVLDPFPRERQALILDSAYNLYRYRVGFERAQPQAVLENESDLLKRRNDLDVALAPERQKPTATSPQSGHKTGRVAPAYGFSNRSHFNELSIRAAVHDQDDPPEGYLPGSQLQMFHLRLRYDQDRRTGYLQQLTLVDLVSFNPWDRWVRSPSWRVQTGLNTANDLNRDPENSLYYGLSGGSGLSHRLPLSRNSLVYAIAGIDSGLGHPFRDRYRIGGGGSAGIMIDVKKRYRAHFDATYYNYLGDSDSATKLQLIQSVPIVQDLEFRVKLERQNVYKEVLLSLLVYL